MLPSYKAIISEQEAIRKNIATYEIKLYTKETQQEIAKKNAMPGDKIEFVELLPSEYTISFTAFDSSKKALYANITDVEVKAGKTENVTLILKKIVFPKFINTKTNETLNITYRYFKNEKAPLPNAPIEWNTERYTFDSWVYITQEAPNGIWYKPGDEFLFDNDEFEFTAYFERTPTEIGFIAYSDNSTSKELIKNKTPIGVVIAVESGVATKILSLEQKECKWNTDSGNVTFTPTTYDDDGYNVRNYYYQQKLNKEGSDKSKGSKLEAMRYAEEYVVDGREWYVPAKNELSQIYNNKTMLNNVLSQIEGAEKIKSEQYWSSTYQNDIYIIDMSTGDLETTQYVGNKKYARLIARFTETDGE